MSTKSGCAVYIGNLDERVSERVLYDILIQVGRVVDLYIPRDKETERPKGYAFAEYETEEIAEYAVKLFSGLVTLYNRTLKFAISGQDKPSPAAITPRHHVPYNNMESSQHSMGLKTPCRLSAHPVNNAQASSDVLHQPNRNSSQHDGNNYDYSRRVFGATLDNISRSRSRYYDSSSPITYPSY
ncbi:RNA-binding protein 7-like [Vitis riparia]|uniref:RNA-binding protein 7-like n=1 Tax=Vitis riparia TaxID=96939 RepID=UPI00155AF74A|nr:RNA-binding protein 7-like [Vitis riparia]